MNSKTTSPSNRKVVPALLALLLPILTLAGCNGAYSGTSSGTNYPYLSGVTLQPGAAPSIAVAGTVQVGANGAYQDSATEISYNDVTSSATWSTSNGAVATVNKGLVTGTGIGSATITASLNGKTGTTTVVVGQTPTLDVTPTGTGTFSLSANPDQHFQVSASYSDGTVLDLTIYATWNSSVPGVLKFYGPYDYTHDPGEATLLATGTTTITASLDSGDVGALDVTVIP
jgi:trimeric autotransporter adhesin